VISLITCPKDAIFIYGVAVVVITPVEVGQRTIIIPPGTEADWYAHSVGCVIPVERRERVAYTVGQRVTYTRQKDSVINSSCYKIEAEHTDYK